jgi:hypothetical protein
MNQNSNFVVEFLSEVNLILAQFDSGNRLYDVLQPVKNLFLKENSLLSYSICRYNGGNPQLSFFCEWFYQICKITDNTNPLKTENQEYFGKKIIPELKELKNVGFIVDHDIDTFILTQIAILHSKTRELNDLAMRKNPTTAKYLDYNYINKFFANQYHTRKPLYAKTSIAEFLEAKSGTLGFVQIGLPFLIGCSYNFGQPDSIVNPESIKWVLLEELLKNISTLYEINKSHDFEEFLITQPMSKEELQQWHTMDTKNQFQKIMSSGEVREQYNLNRNKIIENINANIDHIKLPEKSKEILMDLFDWAKQTR